MMFEHIWWAIYGVLMGGLAVTIWYEALASAKERTKRLDVDKVKEDGGECKTNLVDLTQDYNLSWTLTIPEKDLKKPYTCRKCGSHEYYVFGKRFAKFCKPCRDKNSEKLKEYGREYYNANKAKVKAGQKAWRAKRKEARCETK